MPKWIGGKPWFKLRELIDLFVAMGCQPQQFQGEEVEAFGSWVVCYLFNPETETFVIVEETDMDRHIAPTVLESWERTLCIEIPKGKKN